MNPIWITVCDQKTEGVIFEGTQLDWANTYFHNATISNIISSLGNEDMFEGTTFTIRQMQDDEVEACFGLKEFAARMKRMDDDSNLDV